MQDILLNRGRPSLHTPALGPAIAVHRGRLRLSQSALARRVGVSPATINRYERGHTAPPLETLNVLARVLGVSADELLGPDSGTRPSSRNHSNRESREGGDRPLREQALRVEPASLFRSHPALYKWWTSRKADLVKAGVNFDVAEKTERFVSDFVQLREELPSDQEDAVESEELFRFLDEQIVPDVLRRLQRTRSNTVPAV